MKGENDMANKGWKGRKCAAACLGSGMMLAALAFAQNYGEDTVLAAEEQVTLSIAGETESETDIQETETLTSDSIELAIADGEREKQKLHRIRQKSRQR